MCVFKAKKVGKSLGTYKKIFSTVYLPLLLEGLGWRSPGVIGLSSSASSSSAELDGRTAPGGK